MASSIEIASSSSPFGHGLRTHSLRDRWINRDKSNASAFRSFKDFVESFSGQPNKKPSIAVYENDVHDKNINNNDVQINHAELFVHVPTYLKNDEKINQETEFVSAPATPVKNTTTPDSKASNEGGVSSLVRKWRDFEAEAKNSANSSPLASRANSLESNKANTNSNLSDNGDNESCINTRMNEDISGDRVVENEENEKMRVKMLIHKLTKTAPGAATAGANDENGNGCEANASSSMGSPRIRWRQQAFGDLLMGMQKDRHMELDGLEERKVVSRFSQNGRIQAMLRVQLLRGALEDARKSNGTSVEVHRLPQSIRRLSGRFEPVFQVSANEAKSLKTEVADSTKVEKSTPVQESKCTHQQEVATLITTRKEAENAHNAEIVVKSGEVEEKKAEEKNILPTASSGNAHEEACSRLVVKSGIFEEKNIVNAASSGTAHEEACSKPDFLLETTNQENKNCSVNLSVETCVHSTEVKDVCSTDGDKNTLQSSGISVDLQENQQAEETIDHRRNESITPEECEEVLSNQYLTESENGWVSDVSHTQAGWDELQSDYEQQTTGMQDWIWDVSRPRSEWEGLRKERYQEMLDPFKQKEDIRRLLESKSVSSFLSSGLRDCIDRLMISRTQQQPSKSGSQTDEQEAEVEVEEEKFEYRVEREHEVEKVVIEEAKGGDAGYYEDDEDDEDENQDEQQYEESVEYADQTPPSLPLASWNTNPGPETSNFSEQVGFSPLQQNSSPNSCSQESRPPASMTNQCLIEVQLIYDLKRHMEQLHQEVSELRKSMKSCMNMQHKLRRSVKQDIVAALSQSGQNRSRHSTPKKGLITRSMCCICNDEQVDSLMYRCGHMCACFKCAHDLKCGLGKCPVCQAPILDIVRVKANS